ncbi:alpha/beta hydrolase [Azorhizobium oxalatiphilum]|uniref:Alpha/beta hydrolase n=1 Tax=Azorhizobium oxalatiphilum TaxID=980631 RepID=A0A917BYX5_9HYPH|nr:alpha/beta fold hydrolase [Azorhizobium oxalatiphilum]GGF63881.1 alpha/beta hydrolase [Azorhizobium oxalatiphilum]
MAEPSFPGRARAPVALRGGALRGEIGYLRTGSGSPVVLIHGVGMNAEIWAPQIAALAAHHDVIAMDMPGHGGSLLPPADATLDDYADAVIGLLDALGLPQAALVGHSMGALVATHTALSHPARVSRLVAMNAVYCRPEAVKIAVRERAAELEEKGFSASIAPTMERWFGDPVPAHLVDVAAIASRALRTVDAEGYRRTYWLFATSDEAFADTLHTLAMPALFYTAEFDPNSSPAMSRQMAERAPQGRAEVLADARHMMALTHPDAVNASLIAFLNEADAGVQKLEPIKP